MCVCEAFLAINVTILGIQSEIILTKGKGCLNQGKEGETFCISDAMTSSNVIGKKY